MIISVIQEVNHQFTYLIDSVKSTEHITMIKICSGQMWPTIAEAAIVA